MSKLRESARGETCTFQIPGVCNHDPATVVLCHGPHPDKGMAHKGPDSWSAYGCWPCHEMMDGRRPWIYQDEAYSRVVVWFEAIRETQRRMIAKGLLPK